jgi:putative DNA modification/repair radical SAM protein
VIGLANMILRQSVDLGERLTQMREDARYDVSDNDSACIPDLNAIKTSIHSKAAPPKVPKVFLANDCVFNCAYCNCRVSNECKRRYVMTPRELADVAVREANQNRRGIFITSAIYKNPDYTEELIIETLKIIRNEHLFGGYVHAKIMPGADPRLIREAGKYANRLSVNIEVAKSEGYQMIAKQKNKNNILTPMGQISDMIAEARTKGGWQQPRFATSQTTQLMAGSTGEDDHTILKLSSALYRKYGLKRVYYTAFHYGQPAAGYNLSFTETPSWRMSRLYQADRLMQLYGFMPNEIAPEQAPYLLEDVDPKAAFALRNLHLYPVEANSADYETLLRVPGIGITYAKRIIEARRHCAVTFDVLRKIGVSLKRCRFFLLCGGKAVETIPLDPVMLRGLLSSHGG